MRKLFVPLLAVLVLVGCITPAAHAAPTDPVQGQIEEILRNHPGGTQTGPNTITWQNGTITLRLAGENEIAAVGSCPSGRYCAYNGPNLTGSSLTFASCNTTVSLAALPGAAASLANARTTGYVKGLNSIGSWIATVFEESRLNTVPAGIVSLGCVG